MMKEETMPALTEPLSSLTSAAGLAGATAELAGRLRRSVVTVQDGGRGSGSGVIWDSNGVIVTNHHVASGKEARVTLADGRTINARTRVADPRRDLAILDIDVTGLPAAQAGDSDRLRVGELVFAVGNPLGITGAVTSGIISGLGARSARGKRGREPLIQADVSLAPGNSGGLLAQADGRVIGINAMFHWPGLALAVPSNAVVALLTSGIAERAYLGVSLQPAAVPSAWQGRLGDGRFGFIVTGIDPQSPAERAGLWPGDLIVAVEGEVFGSAGDFGRLLADLEPGDGLELGVLRGGRPRTLSVLAGRALAEAA